MADVEKGNIADDAPAVLFVNHEVVTCGVHQYGRHLFSALQRCTDFRISAVNIAGIADLDRAVSAGSYSAILVNYHPQTMPFLRLQSPRRYKSPCVAVVHEMTQKEADEFPRGFFQFAAMGDPTLKQTRPWIFPTGRIIPEFSRSPGAPSIPTIGSFGFAQEVKGFRRLVSIVQEEFDEALIRLHIPPNGIIDPTGSRARRIVSECVGMIWKPGIRLLTTHDFIDDDQLMDFLASNTLNAFLYDYLPQAGISSAVDHAMAARRPIAITQSTMFRHLHDLNPPITIEQTSMRQIIQNGIRPYEHLLQQWSEDAIASCYSNILNSVISNPHESDSGRPSVGYRQGQRQEHSETVTRLLRSARWRAKKYVSEPIGSALRVTRASLSALTRTNSGYGAFNRVLDDSARFELRHAIRRLEDLVPEVMAKKIPRANVQQAFVFQAVEKFASNYVKPRILCVGSFEDSAAQALKRIGYAIDEVDPAVNRMDLDAFYERRPELLGEFDMVISTSVLEHVKDDGRFIRRCIEFLAPGGVGIFTCDFMDGYDVGSPVIAGNHRFYSARDLSTRIVGLLEDCELVDRPAWGAGVHDFELGGFRYAFATLVFRKSQVPAVTVAWERMRASDRARYFEDNGFVLLPGLLAVDEVQAAIAEVAAFGLKGTTEAIWEPSFTRRLVTAPRLLETIRSIFGDDIRFFKGAYVQTPPQAHDAAKKDLPALHVDYGIGEREHDFRNSSSSWLNVGIYLTDLTEKHAPLLVVPRSNRIYRMRPSSDMEVLRPQAKMVLARAGDAVLFHAHTVHAASTNVSSQERHALFYSYRPAWARAAGPVAEWPRAFIESFPASERALLENLNGGL